MSMDICILLAYAAGALFIFTGRVCLACVGYWVRTRRIDDCVTPQSNFSCNRVNSSLYSQ